MKRIILAIALIAAGLGGGYAWFVAGENDPRETWQGWVEADSLFIGPDLAGRLTGLSLKRGDRVTAGAQLFAVEGDVAAGEVNAAEAALAQAAARLAAASASRQRPQEIDVLMAREQAAQASLEASQLDYERARTLTAKGTMAASVLDQARAAFERDTALLEEVRHQIAVARLPARAPDRDTARAALAEARARLARTRLQAEKRIVTAPADGTIQEVYFRPGEVVGAGRPVVSLLPPGALKIRFFVPEAMLPALVVGDTVTITCDGCQPTRATIDFLAEKAEYTPPVIYSLEERAKLVFRVEAVPDKPDNLRVGQPVTVEREAGS